MISSGSAKEKDGVFSSFSQASFVFMNDENEFVGHIRASATASTAAARGVAVTFVLVDQSYRGKKLAPR